MYGIVETDKPHSSAMTTEACFKHYLPDWIEIRFSSRASEVLISRARVSQRLESGIGEVAQAWI